jgi:hypothetical protein
MSFLFGKPEIPESPKPPDISGEEVQAARERQRRLLAGMKGRKDTYLTGALGLTEPAPVAQKMLLGA